MSRVLPWAHHVDVLVAVEPVARQARVEAQRRERAEHVLIKRVVVAVDVVRDLRRKGVGSRFGLTSVSKRGVSKGVSLLLCFTNAWQC